MTEKINPPFTPGDVVILNSSPDIPMTVQECFPNDTDANGNQIFGVTVGYLDRNGKPIKKGFPHTMLSLYKPVTDFIQPIGFNRVD